MAEPQNPKTPFEPSKPPPSVPPKASNGSISSSSNGRAYSGHHSKFPHPPDSVNPDPTTLRDQWRFAIRQYSRWYSHAWGTAILAGAAFFALGWIIKGSNPLPSFQGGDDKAQKNKDQLKSSASAQQPN